MSWFDKLLWGGIGAGVAYLALKQRARIETIVRDAIDRTETRPAAPAGAVDEPDMDVSPAGGCSGGCGCAGSCGGTTTIAIGESVPYDRGIVPPTIPGSTGTYETKQAPTIESPPIIPPWIPIDLSFSF